MSINDDTKILCVRIPPNKMSNSICLYTGVGWTRTSRSLR